LSRAGQKMFQLFIAAARAQRVVCVIGAQVETRQQLFVERFIDPIAEQYVVGTLGLTQESALLTACQR
jgi:hypothetical protein